MGVANIASAAFGGLPATGAIARTATNVRAGGQTPVAGMCHALFLLLFMLLAGGLIAFVPLATLAAELGRFLFFGGHIEQALERIEAALEIAESLLLPEVLSQALNTKAVLLYSAKGRIREGYALLHYALEVALEADLPSAALRAYYNLADLDAQSDQYREVPQHMEAGLALARRVGNRFWEWNFLGQLFGYYALGEWDQLLAFAAQQPEDKAAQARGAFLQYLGVIPLVHVLRGDLVEARRVMAVFPARAVWKGL